MRIRSAGLPDESADAAAPDGGAGPVDRVSFRVATRVIVAKFAVVAMLVAVTPFATEALARLVGVLAIIAMSGYAVRDLIARERLRADADGVVAVHGYARRRRLSWSDIEGVHVDARQRLGARTELLELDAGAELFLFSRFDLGVDPGDALAALMAVRRAHGGA